MSAITPTLWFDGTEEAVANFYSSLFPENQVRRMKSLTNRNPMKP